MKYIRGTNTQASFPQGKTQKTKKAPMSPTGHNLFFASSYPPYYLGFCMNHSQLFL